MKQDDYNFYELINGRLSGHRVSAPRDSWDIIQDRLNKKKNRLIAIYWPVAAGIALLVGLGILFNKQSDDTHINSVNTTIVQSEQESLKSEKRDLIQNEITNSRVLRDNRQKKFEQITQPGFSQDDNSDISATKGSNIAANTIDNPAEDEIDHFEPDTQQKSEINSGSNRTQKSEDEIQKAFTLLNEEFEDDENSLVNPDKEKSGITVSGFASPLYSFRNLKGEGSSYYNGSETPLYAYSGGLNISIKATRRLSVTSGIYYSKMGQEIANDQITAVVRRSKSSSSPARSSVYVTNSTGEMSFNYESSNEELQAYQNITSDNPYEGVRQSFEFIEIPLYARFRLIDKRINVALISGFSANLLVGQDASLLLSDGSEISTEIENLNKFNYGTAFGVGLGYDIFKRISFSMEPMFKYYLSSINNNSEIESHPWAVGIYTGLSYSF